MLYNRLKCPGDSLNPFTLCSSFRTICFLCVYMPISSCTTIETNSSSQIGLHGRQNSLSRIKHLLYSLVHQQEDRDNVLRARESGKGVLTAPFRLLKSNRLGVILTFAVYKRYLPSNATPNERIQATNGYAYIFEFD